MTDRNHHQKQRDPGTVYRALVLRAAISGAVRALITWLLEHH